MSDNDIRLAAPTPAESTPRPPLPNLLYLTQADGAPIAIDAAMIYLMRPADRDPRRYDEPLLTRVFISSGPGLGMCAERLGVPQVRNHERTGALIRAALGNAGFPLSERVINAEAVSADA